MGIVPQYLFALFVVGLMLLGLYVVARSLGRGRILTSADRRLVTVVESTVLAQNTSLHVVKAGPRYYLIGGGNGNLSTLTEMPAEEVEPWLASQRAVFAQQTQTLEGFLAKLRRKTP